MKVRASKKNSMRSIAQDIVTVQAGVFHRVHNKGKTKLKYLRVMNPTIIRTQSSDTAFRRRAKTRHQLTVFECHLPASKQPAAEIF